MAAGGRVCDDKGNPPNAARVDNSNWSCILADTTIAEESNTIRLEARHAMLRSQQTGWDLEWGEKV